ncbi:hypothetical protein GQ457_08G037100 [Hibiscus cannabinus]
MPKIETSAHRDKKMVEDSTDCTGRNRGIIIRYLSFRHDVKVLRAIDESFRHDDKVLRAIGESFRHDDKVLRAISKSFRHDDKVLRAIDELFRHDIKDLRAIGESFRHDDKVLRAISESFRHDDKDLRAIGELQWAEEKWRVREEHVIPKPMTTRKGKNEEAWRAMAGWTKKGSALGLGQIGPLETNALTGIIIRMVRSIIRSKILSRFDGISFWSWYVDLGGVATDIKKNKVPKLQNIQTWQSDACRQTHVTTTDIKLKRCQSLATEHKSWQQVIIHQQHHTNQKWRVTRTNASIWMKELKF